MSILYLDNDEPRNIFDAAADGLASAVTSVLQGTQAGEQEIDYFILPPPQGFDDAADLLIGISQVN
jgi:hypothetical protein